MGRSSRPKPERLPGKLLQIRTALGLSQNGMLRLFGLENELFQGDISAYELGRREPPLMLLLAYAEAANVYMEALVRDDVDLPAALPASVKSEGIRRKSSGAKSSKRR